MEAKKRKAEETGERKLTVSEENIAELTDHLNKEQLVGIVKRAALAHVEVLSEVRKLADGDAATRRIFVRGISWSIDNQSLKKAFEEFGPVAEAIVLLEKNTGKSRRFGFVTFEHRVDAMRALQDPSKTIGDCKAICYLSDGREAKTSAAAVASMNSLENVASRRIYVGNLLKNTQKGTLLGFFSQYGEIEVGPSGFDKKGKCRRFALLVYKSEESARKCLLDPVKTMNGNVVLCKIAAALKSKDEDMKPDLMDYRLTKPALIASHIPSLLQTSTESHQEPLTLPAAQSSLHGMDPFMSRSSSLLSPESSYPSSSFSSLF
ncbi:hypothetical protein L7F22_059011 [Adiantum nelumboides]|nr:hypothetical protein [Adiantum nelumboides]